MKYSISKMNSSKQISVEAKLINDIFIIYLK